MKEKNKEKFYLYYPKCFWCPELKSDNCSEMCCYLRDFCSYHNLELCKTTKLDILNNSYKTNKQSIKELFEEVENKCLVAHRTYRNIVSLGNGMIGLGYRKSDDGVKVYFNKLNEYCEPGANYDLSKIDDSVEPFVLEIKNIRAVESLEKIAKNVRKIFEESNNGNKDGNKTKNC